MADRRGVTLLEVLLVLGLLAVLAGITWMALDKPVAAQRLRRAADVVRVAWARARVKSMTSNETIVFRHERDGSRYTLTPHQGVEYAPESRPEELVGQVESSPMDEPASGSPAQSLPENIKFAGGATEYDQRAAALLSGGTTLPGFGDDASPDSVEEAGWSDPIFFYPDGTSTTAELTLENQHGLQVTLSLRGLTGVVTVGDLHSSGEASP